MTGLGPQPASPETHKRELHRADLYKERRRECVRKIPRVAAKTGTVPARSGDWFAAEHTLRIADPSVPWALPSLLLRHHQGLSDPLTRRCLLSGKLPEQPMAALTFPSVCLTSSAVPCSHLSAHRSRPRRPPSCTDTTAHLFPGLMSTGAL